MKAAPVMRALARTGQWRNFLLHTGQHYDEAMAQVFFRQLNIGRPDYDLGVGAGSHAQQTAVIMQRMEPVLLQERPAVVVVYGDVNSTMAATLVAAKLRIPLVHVEAGLRSFDRDMPEEINRLVTDVLADLLLTPSADADENLLREGIPAERIVRVGNVMIDTLYTMLPEAEAWWSSGACANLLEAKHLSAGYGLVTLHRPANVDDPDRLQVLLNALTTVSKRISLVFPVHPRTRQRLKSLCPDLPPRLILVDPQGYVEFLALQKHARFVITDSGGIQEETTVLGVPCLTLRPNTERPVTISHGTNRLVLQPEHLANAVTECLCNPPSPRLPELWDGQAGERIASAISLRIAPKSPLAKAIQFEYPSKA